MEELSVAADDQGVLSFADLAELGWTDQTIRRAVASGRLTRLSRGWFAVGLPTDPTAEHLVRLRAVERAFQETAVASHHSELLRLGLPAYAADLSVVHLCRSDPTKQGRRRRGVMVHSPVPAAAIEDRRLLPAVAVAQHAVAVGAQGGLAAADAGLRTGLLTTEGLDDAFGLVGAHRDIPMLRALMRFADARSESVGESRLRLIGAPPDTIPRRKSWVRRVSRATPRTWHGVFSLRSSYVNVRAEHPERPTLVRAPGVPPQSIGQVPALPSPDTPRGGESAAYRSLPSAQAGVTFSCRRTRG